VSRRLNSYKIVSVLFIFLVVLSCFALILNKSQFIEFQDSYKKNVFNEENSDPKIINNLRIAADEPNGKPLNVHQYANISKTYDEITLPMNINFDLLPGWTSKNVSIHYDGIAQKKDWVSNGDFDSDMSGWTYETNNPSVFTLAGYSSTGNPAGSIKYRFAGGVSEGDYTYFEQNITIPEEFALGTAQLSMNYQVVWTDTFNGTIFISLIVDNVEKNKTINMKSAPLQSWESLILNYDPIAYGQVLPEIATLRVGTHVMANDAINPWNEIYFDNIKCELWTQSNVTGLAEVNDNEFNQNYSYINTDYGEGYTFIDVERYREVSDEISFTVYQNVSDVIDFKIGNINIKSYAEKPFSSEFLGSPRSKIEFGSNITWYTEISISTIPVEYTSWLEVEKPNDWLFTRIIDGYEAQQLNNCSGTHFGSTTLSIPQSILSPGLWSLEAISKNYLSNGTLEVWDDTAFVGQSHVTFGDLFLLNATINKTVSLLNTRINCSIFYPNGTLFWHGSLEPASHSVSFGNFTVGDNMTVGTYNVKIQWTNSQNASAVDQVGYKEFDFTLWHHSSLSAVTSFFEIITGDPLLARVKFTDIDVNLSIAFATIRYNSTFGQSGTMIYLGSGMYLADIDTNSLILGDYYISFNVTSDYYENQSIDNLIHLSVISQELALDVPHTVIEAMANSYATCQINVTGAISGAMIWPANISTDWDRSWNVINHNNGTYTLNFSTTNLPTEGIIDTFTVTIFGNKTNYGATVGYVTISISPISTIINVNSSVVNPPVNTAVDIKVNFTEEGSGQMITGAILTVLWPSIFNVTSNVNGFILRLDTVNLSIDTYTAVLQLEKEGFETSFKTITVNVAHIEIQVNPIDFQDSLDVNIGEMITIRINLTELDSDIYIDNASIWFSWNFGNGYFNYLYDGIYELELEIPDIVGSRTMKLIILKEGSLYKSTEFSFIISITDPLPPTPNSDLPWYVLLIGYILIGVIGILGVVSLRNYVFLPIKRKKESILLANTQRYKDIMNIEAIVISGRETGINFYSKSYYMLKNYQNELLSGFIQAITLISREIIGKEKIEQVAIKSDNLKGKEKIIELDFKHFNFFITDYKDLRIVFILKEKASDRFKEETAKFLSKLTSKISDKMENWDGDLDMFNAILPPLLQNQFQLYYREEFKINPTIDLNRIRKEKDLSKMANRVLNVIISLTQDHKDFNLEDAIGTVHDKNQDKIIEALEVLIEEQIVISSIRELDKSYK
jgi:hypothetical protein